MSWLRWKLAWWRWFREGEKLSARWPRMNAEQCIATLNHYLGSEPRREDYR